MKVRIKFSKLGPVKFLGHLDTMRYFQKAVRRSGLPAAFSGGYSPHMIMSFACPLGVGVESEAEYFDLELAEYVPTEEVTQRLNDVMGEGFHVAGTTEIEEGKAGNAMSLVAAADYLVTFREGKEPDGDFYAGLEDFLSQEEIPFTKVTRKGESQVDLRPNIYEMQRRDDGIFLTLASASSNYTKPEAVMKAYADYLGIELAPFAFQTRRLEIYADEGVEGERKLVTLAYAHAARKEDEN
ncbi:MAG: DUF2344 domain-containing protein [Blautia sp.]|nr:DUF2344 domain-containing protein [Blautia sp.]